MSATKILILYSEIAAYTLSCIEELLRVNPDAEVHLVRWPVNNEAPFVFEFSGKLNEYVRTDFDDNGLHDLSIRISPDLILCSGWIDAGYKKVCAKWNNRIPVVLTMDNKWIGSWKQMIAVLFSRSLVRKYFNACWVPGVQQETFAGKLGFPPEKIRKGFYSCDLNSYNQVYTGSLEKKTQKFPHVFIYAGRFYDFKGVNELWQAFALFRQRNTDWKLICVGNGDQIAPVIEGLECRQFMQPAELQKLMADTGVFILPSKREPWGVVAHEFAAAGFPLLLSAEVGAASAFLENSKNGFLFASGSTEEILKSMQRIAELRDDQLLAMGTRSHQLAQSISPVNWAETLLSFLPKS